MNLRRVLILSITLLAAAGAGYGLLGMKAPRQAPVAQTSVARPQTIIAIGPDGRLYAIQAPQNGYATRGGSGTGRRDREEGGRFVNGYEQE